MAVTWAPSADKHGIPHDEALYAMLHAEAVYEDFEPPREGFQTSPTLYIGPSRFGILKVMVTVTPPSDVSVFHVMRLRESTRLSVGFDGETGK
ncbi:hypothetical protein [Promicromonospora sp. AC04]|uniref:hypothetical protein n=1 Tax=Promicromonospora sp. AC04 TaxID=2135723 RepID=UPI000D34CF99|nr:hypothetical protein [Promicromonospora sp. AC04]